MYGLFVEIAILVAMTHGLLALGRVAGPRRCGLVMGLLFLMPFVGRWKLGHRFNIGLIFALLILPAAAAQHITARPSSAIACSVTIAVLCVWLGLVIGFYLPYPPSFFITTLAFVTFVATRRPQARSAGARRPRGGGSGRGGRTCPPTRRLGPVGARTF